MEEINSHIVSSLKWDTTFDQKNEGYKLQERLSSWSKITLPREVAAIFNELCPQEQSWRIESLELDLGSCDYSDLEFDLSRKIRSLLREKIAELILYQNNQKQNRIAVYNKEKSILENLMVFLLEGSLPWNYQHKEGSVNQIMAELLQNNLTEVIAIIKETGLSHEEVRKRIAWQFDEKNITKIIASLEPNNSSIIEFSSIMVNIQVKETIIQTSTASFKKNLWFFILNFLLLERGTLFNKLAFMKSSILQMANHYNIAYAELIILIENTVVKLSDKTSQNNNFIACLKILTQEYETQKSENYKPETATNYWIVLEQLLKNKNTRKFKTERDNLNELILALSNENKTKFSALIQPIFKDENLLISLIEDLNETSIKILYSKLDTTPSQLHTESVMYLNKLSQTFKLKKNSKVLWQIGILFLIKNKNADNTAFLLFCIKELSKENNLSHEHLLALFTNAKIPAAVKNNNSATIYTSLNAIYCKEISKNNSNYPAVYFKNLVAKLELELQKNSAKSVFFVDLQRSLTRTILLHPKMAFEVMLSYGNKEVLKKILPLILNREMLQLLVKTANYKKTKLVQTIQVVYEILNEKDNYDFPEELMTDNLLLLGMQEILFHPEHNASLFLETIIVQLSKKVTETRRSDYFQFITKLIQSKRIKSFGVAIKKTFINQLKNTKSIDTVALALLIQNTSQEDQQELAQLLTVNFNDAGFVLLRKQDRKESENILNYFLTNGAVLKKNWVQKTSEIIIRNAKSISKTKIIGELNELFWNSILKYSTYKGNEMLFEKLLQKELKLYVKKNITKEETAIQNEANSFESANSLTELMPLLENQILSDDTISNEISESISSAILFEINNLSEKEKYSWISSIVIERKVSTVFSISKTIEIKEILNMIIIKEPKIFFSIMKKEFIPEAQMDWLCRNINFHNLCNAVSQVDKNKELYLRILEKFNHVLGSVKIKGLASKEMQHLLLRKLLKAVTNDNWRLITADRIWNELIWEVVTKKGISKKSFLADLEKYIYQFPPALQLGFKEILRTEKQTAPLLKQPEIFSKMELIKIKERPKNSPKLGIPVRNAGIVLLNDYIAMLFERLQLTSENKFISNEHQVRAVQYLQYVITGMQETEEIYLPLNKVLCGLPLTDTVPDFVEITDSEKQLINGLIQAAISHWPEIGDCSVDGFRGNWLVRDGILVEHEDKWELTVDKRAYDILINRSPFAFSIMKYHWIDKPLHVIWPY
ncbi:contractile injection system tape measure protein [Flavobacterium sp. DG2-3]|uniref:contractile injection system tape measure protein n=1 Tax=Flavobacterium sp. DG2-3 TaxID=3068317 RepID=UPI00273E1C94|nr:contractile injection system tape measure protein [Flavobacterium sp. DG2-3]MDP5199823.1 contractile injection system tape measure protein [Flavobacterium sp. DG2-3]